MNKNVNIDIEMASEQEIKRMSLFPQIPVSICYKHSTFCIDTKNNHSVRFFLCENGLEPIFPYVLQEILQSA